MVNKNRFHQYWKQYNVCHTNAQHQWPSSKNLLIGFPVRGIQIAVMPEEIVHFVATTNWLPTSEAYVSSERRSRSCNITQLEPILGRDSVLDAGVGKRDIMGDIVKPSQQSELFTVPWDVLTRSYQIHNVMLIGDNLWKFWQRKCWGSKQIWHTRRWPESTASISDSRR